MDMNFFQYSFENIMFLKLKRMTLNFNFKDECFGIMFNWTLDIYS